MFFCIAYFTKMGSQYTVFSILLFLIHVYLDKFILKYNIGSATCPDPAALTLSD